MYNKYYDFFIYKNVWYIFHENITLHTDDIDSLVIYISTWMMHMEIL